MESLARTALCLAALLGLAAGNFVSPGLKKCLDIHAKLKSDGTRQKLEDMQKETDPINVQLYKCHDEHNQDFGIVGGTIKSESLGWCVTADKAEANANVALAKCDGSDLQQWDLLPTSYVQLKGTKQCLDVKAAKKDDGTYEKWDEIKEHTTVNVQLYDCHDPDTERVNQLWEWAPISGDDIMRLWALHGAVATLGAGSSLPTLAGACAGAAGLFAVGLFVGRRTARQPALGEILTANE